LLRGEIVLSGTAAVKKITAVFEKYKYLLLVIAAGIILLIIPTGSGVKKDAAVSDKEDFSVTEQEKKLTELISSIQGAGRVKVMLTIKSGTETVYENEEQSDISRSETENAASYTFEQSQDVKPVVLSDGSGSEKPVIRKKVYPEYQGAVIVCDGADNASLRLKIVEAVSSLLNLGTDKITVARMKT
jgi:stage III sporulation protein AG